MKITRQHIARLGLSSFLLFSPAGAPRVTAHEPPAWTNPPPAHLVVAEDWNYPPFSFLQDGQPAGFNVELMQHLARWARVEVSFQLQPWTEARQALEEARVQAIGGMFYSPERDQKVDFTLAHTVVLHDFFVRHDSRIRQLADLRDKTVLVQEADILHDWLLKTNLCGRLVPVADIPDMLRRVARGEGDAAAVGLFQGEYYTRELRLNNLRRLGAVLAPQDYCMAVREGDEQLRLLLNEGLAVLKRTGEYQALHDRWLKPYERSSSWSWFRRFSWIFALLLLFLLGGSVWTWMLRRTVHNQTQRLLLAQDELEQRGRLLAAVAEAGARLLATPDLEVVIPAVLEDLGQTTQVDRVFICEELVNPEGEHPIQSLRWEWTSLQQVPDDLINPTSRLMVPISAGSDVWGVIGFEYFRGPRSWAEADVDALRTAADAVGSALMRRAQETALQQGARREQQAAARWKALMDALPALVWIAHDRECSQITGNRAANHLMGLAENANASLSAPEGERPAHVRFFHEGVELATNQLPLQRVAREGIEMRGYEEEMVLADGTRRFMLGNVVPLLDESGQPDGAVASFLDITELKRIEEERRHLERQILQSQKLESLGVLAGGIAHDFNNLLMMILGNADLARSELPTGSPAASSLREIEQASRRAAELCRQMLAYSGKGRFLVEKIRLSNLVEDISHMLEISVSKKALLQYDFARELPLIEADATQIRQVVMNLIINASEAIGDRSGVIRVSTGAAKCTDADLSGAILGDQAAPGAYVYLEVSDSGCGMDGDTIARIFEPFFTTKFTGRGLGLAAVLGIVRAHNGVIQVHSAPGRGTRFRVLLPALPEAKAVPEPSASEPVLPDTWRGHGLVLLADDEEGIRFVGRRMLEQLGFQVVNATDGAEALRLFKARAAEWTCALLDLTMPVMDGVEVLQKIREIRPDLKVILSSGYDEDDIARRHAQAGASAFVQKPYEIRTLRRKMREILES